MKNNKLDFVNAQEMMEQNPNTFEAPTLDELNNIQLNDFVKVSIGGERFWVCVGKLITDEIIEGVVNNDLLCTDVHGIECDDKIIFNKSNIFSIYEE